MKKISLLIASAALSLSFTHISSADAVQQCIINMCAGQPGASACATSPGVRGYCESQYGGSTGGSGSSSGGGSTTDPVEQCIIDTCSGQAGASACASSPGVRASCGG